MNPLALFDAEIARLEAELARARDARELCARLAGPPPSAPTPAPSAERVTTPPPPEEAAPGKPEPRPTPSAPGRGNKHAPRIAKLLAARGPLRADQVAEALGLTPTAASWQLRQHPHLFEKADAGNRLSPWTLTAAGRAAAA